MQRIKMIKVPFNHRWPNGRVSVVRELGPFPVGTGKGEIDPDLAEAAVAAGFAKKFDPRKPAAPRGQALSPAKATDTKGSDDAADEGKSNRVDGAGLAADGGPDDQRPAAAAE